MGDIAQATWQGDPIEIMFLDVLKSPEIQLNIMRQVMPKLLVGGILIQQEYFIDGLPFLKIMQEMLAEHFEYLGEIQSSAIFRLTSRIDVTRFTEDPVAALPLDRQLALLDQARDRSVSPTRRLLCDLGKVRFFSGLYDLKSAQALLESLPEHYPEQFSELQSPRIISAIRTATNHANGMHLPRTRKGLWLRLVNRFRKWRAAASR